MTETNSKRRGGTLGWVVAVLMGVGFLTYIYSDKIPDFVGMARAGWSAALAYPAPAVTVKATVPTVTAMTTTPTAAVAPTKPATTKTTKVTGVTTAVVPTKPATTKTTPVKTTPAKAPKKPKKQKPAASETNVTPVGFELQTGQNTPNALILNGVVHAIPVNRICALPTFQGITVTRDAKGFVLIGGYKTNIICRSANGGGGSSGGSSGGNHTGQTAEEVAHDTLGLGPDSVTTIDPGPVVEQKGVKDTNHDGTAADEADAITARGVTQDKTQPAQADAGQPATENGNEAVDVFN